MHTGIDGNKEREEVWEVGGWGEEVGECTEEQHCCHGDRKL